MHIKRNVCNRSVPFNVYTDPGTSVNIFYQSGEGFDFFEWLFTSPADAAVECDILQNKFNSWK